MFEIFCDGILAGNFCLDWLEVGAQTKGGLAHC